MIRGRSTRRELTRWDLLLAAAEKKRTRCRRRFFESVPCRQACRKCFPSNRQSAAQSRQIIGPARGLRSSMWESLAGIRGWSLPRRMLVQTERHLQRCRTQDRLTRCCAPHDETFLPGLRSPRQMHCEPRFACGARVERFL